MEEDFNIVCPHCGHKHDGLDYIELNDMDGDFDMNCEGCGEEFFVKFKLSINFEIAKERE